MASARIALKIGKVFEPLVGKIGVSTFEVEKIGKNLLYRETILKDSLYYNGKVRLSTGSEILNVVDNVFNSASKVSVPYIMYHGSADRIVRSFYNVSGFTIEN